MTREVNSPDGVWRIGAVAITDVDSPDSVGRISGPPACLDPELRTRASSAPEACAVHLPAEIEGPHLPEVLTGEAAAQPGCQVVR